MLPVDIEHLTKAYGDHVVLDGVDMQIRRGEKVAFVGKNGEGKSTLVKCIMNEIPYSGTMKLGHGVKIGYFAQNQASLLDGERTVFETIDYVATGEIRTKIRDILGAFMFGGEASEKKVKVLSGGEKSRLAMIRLLLEPVNLLILDEPTNHLDMRSKDVLKEAIRAFNGTVILVSHDRDFLDGIVDKVYEFANRKTILHLGGIREFLEEKRIESLHEIERTRQPEKPAVPDSPAPVVSDSKLAYEQRKEAARALKKLERTVADYEAKIGAAETEIASMEGRFAAGESSGELMKAYNNAKHELDKLMYEWELVSGELEEKRAAPGE